MDSRADTTIAAGLDVVATRAHILAATAFEVSGLAGRAGAGISHHGTSMARTYTQGGILFVSPHRRFQMCSPVKCEQCSKVTWSGCGEHVDQVKSMFTEEEWCTCARWGL